LQPRLTGEAVQAKEAAQNNVVGANSGAPPGVEFEILANYNPLPEGEAYTKADDAKKDAKASAAKDAGTKAPVAKNPSAKTMPRKGDGIVLKPYSATHPAAKPPMKGGGL